MLIKRLLGVILFLLAVNAGIRLAVVYYHDQQFKDSVREYALFAGQPPLKADEVIRGKVMDLARQNEIPLDPDFVEISRQSIAGVGDKVTIKFSYAVIVQLMPGYARRFDFSYSTP